MPVDLPMPHRLAAVPAGAQPDRVALVDGFGRVARDLRVSLTDRCNLRCTYCMPAEGLAWTPDERILTNDELVRLIGLAVARLGITSVRLTGGEPLLRKDLEPLIAAIATLEPRPTIALTTNGIGLAVRARRLKAAGLDRVNISLDTLDADTYATLTRRPRVHDVIAAITAAQEAGLAPVKVNAVLMRDVNLHEAADLVDFAHDAGVQLRFIEQMPLDAGHSWDRSTMVTADEIHALLAQRFRLEALDERRTPRGSAPAELFHVVRPEAPELPEQHVGIIAAVTQPFCGACDRVRLTADGQLRNCLFSLVETDLRTPLRAGADDDTLVALWRGEVAAKRAGHGIDDESFLQPPRPMSAIGG